MEARGFSRVRLLGEDDCYDAFVTITDGTTGDKFKTGAGAVDEDVMDMFADLGHSHTL